MLVVPANTVNKSSPPAVEIEQICAQLAALATQGAEASRRLVAEAEREIDHLRKVHAQACLASWRFCLISQRVEWSEAMHLLFGTDAGTIQPDLEMTIRLAQAADRARLKRAFETVQRHGKTASCAWRRRNAGSDLRWFWTEFSPEYDGAGAMTAISALCQDVTRQKAGTDAPDHPSRRDMLTGLLNRPGLSVELAKLFAVQAAQPLAALCLDIDGLKTINDIHGYCAGDDVLREVARRLTRQCRDTDVIARLGGDEFVIIQTGKAQPLGAQALARQLLKSLAEPYRISDVMEAMLTSSIGIALHPDDAETPEGLLSHAGQALDQAKRCGRNGLALYDRRMEQDQRARYRLEQDLRLALQKQELKLVYQPLFAAESRVVTGFESLLRWSSAEHGAVSPDVFIPIAEANGLMGEIGEWVLRAACKEAARWAIPLRIAVNVSPVQIQQGGLAETIEAILQETGLSPARLEIEITETILLKDTERAISTLQRIRRLGVQIAIDDFGTGYSSLATLRAFPFDKLKVDRSFIKDLGETHDALAIVEAILGLSRGLRLPVVAEGVETEAQVEILRRCGCDEMQGYLLSHPLPIDRFIELVGPPIPAAVPALEHCHATTQV